MLRRWLPSLAILAFTGLGFALAPLAYSNQFLLFNMMMYMALAQGLNIIYGYTGYLPFGYVGFFGAGAYGAAIIITFWHWPALLAVLGGGLVAVIFGLLLTPLFRLSGAYFSIANLAAAEALYYLVANPHMTTLTQGPYGINLPQAYAPDLAYATMLAILLFAVGAAAYLRRSRFGLALAAIREDAVSASMAGIDVVRARAVAWLLSAFIAGLAGAAYGWYISVFYPDTVFALSITVFTIVFVLFGGQGTVLGPLIGTLLLYGAYNVIGISNPQYFQLAYGILIVVLVLFLPAGLASLLRRRRTAHER